MDKTNIVDQYHGDPTYAQLHVLVRGRPQAREMLKTAAFTETHVDALPSSAFAWEDERRFPVHTREDTVASILYRSKLGSFVPACVDAKLVKAAQVFGVTAEPFRVKVAEEAPVEYALPEEQRLPLGNAGQIKVAEHVLCRDFKVLPLEKRADAFSKLAQAARRQGVELNPLTQKMAGLTVSNTVVLRDWLEARATASNGEVREAFDKLAVGLSTAPACLQDRKDLVKLASAIEQLDRQAGLDKYYDHKLPDPLQTVFNTEKVATLLVDVAGVEVPVESVMRLPVSVWEQVGMPEMVEVVESRDAAAFKQVFDTLPLDIKIELKAQIGV